ncbi:DUF3043 domain-containing protein [Nocardioides sp.]|uniref:DUF3043 domain-containing protein n=1 Tax=Nocardioides sp. TaxID=35761 RepID=UPI001A2849D2|nr:DUF3043 domain-containing protein [Nocardioides sp.]MBJ7356381.1 DUF3043 domain-containing protein [Nocardioides sp.]
MFRRSKSDTATAEAGQPEGHASGKGRPTPTRKEAEAAARARAKVPRTRKEMLAAQRMAKTESSAKVRAGMKAGEERYLLPRDKGPVRRFVRDFVDSRLSFVELLIPLLVVTMVLGYSGNEAMRSIGNTILLGTVLLVIVDMVTLRMRLRRQLAERFPDEPTKGLTYYAITRALQMKFMRLPKARVKIGQQLPDDYHR